MQQFPFPDHPRPDLCVAIITQLCHYIPAETVLNNCKIVLQLCFFTSLNFVQSDNLIHHVISGTLLTFIHFKPLYRNRKLFLAMFGKKLLFPCIPSNYLESVNTGWNMTRIKHYCILSTVHLEFSSSYMKMTREGFML